MAEPSANPRSKRKLLKRWRWIILIAIVILILFFMDYFPSQSRSGLT